MKELTPKQKKFCQEYLKDFNASRAYKAVYKVKSDNQARANGSRLIANDNVSEYLSETMHQTKVNDILDINGVLDNLSQLAIGKPGKSAQLPDAAPEVGYPLHLQRQPADADFRSRWSGGLVE